ncbi:MAG: sulfotransferase [Symplocastrum torsivum CPER-KK1]|uniref:Sulfotransferase n=1 Tax=Symplocastrum torsivum CPER-KK1 TaxID=450513 RepID=A0A951PLI5_9CYAN|nr:sulfotransferase [Symplocastrum torsivum CPER-KK1]
MTEPLIILCPLRSFSSVGCAMIGQHPEMYGFPELNLFVADSVEEMLLYYLRQGRPQGLHGLLRTLAQLHDGVQTETSIFKVRAWLQERMDWSTKKMFDYILERISPRIGVDKSPVTVMKPEFIERAYAMFPKANFLHLTRHPISAAKSIREYLKQMSEVRENLFKPMLKTSGTPKPLIKNALKETTFDPARLWLYTHSSIINFTSTLPVGQSMRLKGEDLLSEPDLYLPQIADWLGLRVDQDAIEAMKHPENSSYACRGPLGARGGNDLKFLDSPRLRSGKISELSLKSKTELDWALNRQSSQKIIHLAKQMGYQ